MARGGSSSDSIDAGVRKLRRRSSAPGERELRRAAVRDEVAAADAPRLLHRLEHLLEALASLRGLEPPALAHAAALVQRVLASAQCPQ